MRILTTQINPTSGEARSFELDVIKRAAAVRKVIGYVQQETSVWSDLSGFESLCLRENI